MINISRFDAGFLQGNNACVMASYANAMNYFTGIPQMEAFKTYCRHYGVPHTDKDAQDAFGRHFNSDVHNKCGLDYRCQVI